MKKNFLYVASMLALICFASKAVEEGAATKLKRTTSSIDLGDFYKGKKAVGDIGEKLVKFMQKNPQATIPLREVFGNTNEVSVMNELFDLAQNIGYEERKVKRGEGEKEETYYAVDISYPAIKRFASSLVGNSESTLKSILEKYGEISHVAGDKTKTDISGDRLNAFVEHAMLFFDLSKLENSDDRNKVREWMKTVAANYSGFQRIMLMMMSLCLDFRKGVIVETPLKIKIEKTMGFSCFFCETIGIDKNCFSENQRLAPYALIHEGGHAIHHHIFGKSFYNDAIPFFVSSVSSSDALLDKFFPMLKSDNFPEKKEVLDNIEKVVEAEGISKKLSEAISSGKKIEELDSREQTILNIFYVIIGQGFGSIVFGDGWEDKTIADLLTQQNIALALYMRTLMFSTFKDGYWTEDQDPDLKSIDNLKNNWLSLEEILTMFGIIPFYLNDKLIILEDRQNEQIFHLRNTQDGEVKKVYRTHALHPPIDKMDELLSKILGVEKGIFFNCNIERDKLILPSNPVYSEEDNLPSSELFFKNSKNPMLTNALYSGITQGNNAFVKKLLTKITAEEISKPNADGKTLLGAAIEANNTEIVDILLNIAAGKGYSEDIVKLLLNEGASTNLKDSQEEYPLHLAVKARNLNIVRSLLSFRNALCKREGWLRADPRSLRLDPNVKNSQGETPLLIAVKEKQVEIVVCLMRNGADFSIQDQERNTPLYIAVESGNTEMVRSLLIYVKRDRLSKGCNIKNSSGKTPLHIAVKKNQVEIVKCLMNHEANLNIQDQEGNTPLHIAVESGNTGMVQLLSSYSEGKIDCLSRGFNIKNSSGEIPLHMAIRNGRLDMVELLLRDSRSRNIRNSSGDTPLHIAVNLGNTEMVKLFLGVEMSPNIKNSSGDAPLHIAARMGNKALVEAILDKPIVSPMFSIKVEPNIQNSQKETPLHIAVRGGHMNIVDLLLERGAVDYPNSFGQTPLHVVAYKPVFTDADEAVVRSLLADRRINLNAEDNLKNTPLHYAALYNNRLLTQLLLDKGANPNAQNREGDTPLHCAVQAANNGAGEVVQLLLNKKANPHIGNSKKETPRDVAVSRKNSEDVIRLLPESNSLRRFIGK
ncbi:MAG: ankyrin repeat domain-containing protein [Holosporaceae bacterium]|nr:ankyrin repeat domain-containing protein [Holosporaceae bacterium]